ncbi:MAG: carboxypeptidase regulatory-like domain-containing protein, partial [Pedobacter agri]
IEAEELHKIISLTDYLRSRFAGVRIINNKVIGTWQGKEGPMLILLNSQNIEDLSFVNPRSLTGVQIIKGGVTAAGMANQFGESLYGQGVCFGIIFLTSNHHNPNFTKVTEQTTGIIRKKIPGFAAPKAFSSPNYAIKKDDIAKDLRDPLFWKPDIITDKEGMATLHFYTADEKGRYQVTLEGIGINGKITREVAFFTVK